MDVYQSGESGDPARLEALRARQQRQTARGCLLALVLEGAALLAAGLWVLAMFLELPRLKAAGLGAFVVFTLAALMVGLWLLVAGNLPAQRRLRQDYERSAGRPGSTVDADRRFDSGPDKRAI